VDRQDAKPRRPSLLAEGANRCAARPARTLADLENHSAGRRRAAPGSGRARWWLTAAGVLAVAASGWLGSNHATQFLRIEALEPDAARPVAGISAEPAIAPSAAAFAAIVDEPPPAAAMAAPKDAAPGARGDAANPFASAARTPVDPAHAPPAARGGGRVTPAPDRGERPIAPAPRAGEPDLLASLLRNIHRQEAAASRDPDALDALIQQVRDNDNAAPDRGTSAATPARAEQVQRQLRACPPPNSARGLRCRQDVCAAHAGRDQACPAG